MTFKRDGKLKHRYKFALAALGAFIGVTAALYFIQERLIFWRSSLDQDYKFNFKTNFDEVFLEISEETKLHALLFKTKNPKGVILYFHGNRGDLSRWGSIVESFVDFEHDVFVVDYRSYGKSIGKMSEQALYDDAQSCYDYLLKIYDEKEITIYGRSLGTGIATYVAANNSPKKLLLETPYYSLVDIAKSRFPIFPISTMIKYTIPTFSFISEVQCPIDIIHGTEDRIVPISSGQKLFDMAPSAYSTMTIIEGGRHNNLVEYKIYEDWISKALD